jgi:lysophospholipid acyltransferase (LPLAT)-like uncharacterized protein
MAGRADFSPKQRIGFAAASYAARAYTRLISATCTMRSLGDESFRANVMRATGTGNAVWVLWHNRLAQFVAYCESTARVTPRLSIASIVSASRDGELLARPIREMGGAEVRGSSSVGGAAALRDALAAVQAGMFIATVGDSPLGPRYELKPGPILLAKAAGVPIIPVACSCSRVLQLHRAWDQMMVPLPFSRITVRFGEPMQVPADAGQDEISTLRRELEQRLARLTDWADNETRVAWQLPKPKRGEVLKRRKRQEIAARRK